MKNCQPANLKIGINLPFGQDKRGEFWWTTDYQFSYVYIKIPYRKENQKTEVLRRYHYNNHEQYQGLWIVIFENNQSLGQLREGDVVMNNMF